mgnify:FL=1
MPSNSKTFGSFVSDLALYGTVITIHHSSTASFLNPLNNFYKELTDDLVRSCVKFSKVMT